MAAGQSLRAEKIAAARGGALGAAPRRGGPRAAAGFSEGGGVSILPNKRVRVSDSLLNVGAILLVAMRPSQTVTELWDRVRARPEIRTFARFVLGLDLLFILGAVDYRDGMLVRGP